MGFPVMFDPHVRCVVSKQSKHIRFLKRWANPHGEMSFSSIPGLSSFNCWRRVMFCQVFFLHLLTWPYNFCAFFIDTMYYINSFSNVEPTCLPRANPICSWFIILFIWGLTQFAKFVEGLCIWTMKDTSLWLSCSVFGWFDVKVKLGCEVEVFSTLLFLKEFVASWYSLLKVWQNPQVKPSVSSLWEFIAC
jgi:hypothetical protein